MGKDRGRILEYNSHCSNIERCNSATSMAAKVNSATPVCQDLPKIAGNYILVETFILHLMNVQCLIMFKEAWQHFIEKILFHWGASQKCIILRCIIARAQRVGVFNFGTDRVRVLEKIFRDGSGMDWVRVFSSYT